MSSVFQMVWGNGFHTGYDVGHITGYNTGQTAGVVAGVLVTTAVIVGAYTLVEFNRKVTEELSFSKEELRTIYVYALNYLNCIEARKKTDILLNSLQNKSYKLTMRRRTFSCSKTKNIMHILSRVTLCFSCLKKDNGHLEELKKECLVDERDEDLLMPLNRLK